MLGRVKGSLAQRGGYAALDPPSALRQRSRASDGRTEPPAGVLSIGYAMAIRGMSAPSTSMGEKWLKPINQCDSQHLVEQESQKGHEVRLAAADAPVQVDRLIAPIAQGQTDEAQGAIEGVDKCLGDQHDDEYRAKRDDVLHVYYDIPLDEHIICLDEKTGIQAVERRYADLPMQPGKSVRRELYTNSANRGFSPTSQEAR